MESGNKRAPTKQETERIWAASREMASLLMGARGLSATEAFNVILRSLCVFSLIAEDYPKERLLANVADTYDAIKAAMCAGSNVN